MSAVDSINTVNEANLGSVQELQQSLLQTISDISINTANKSNAAVIVKAEIVEEKDAGLRRYSVSYGGAIYENVYSITDTKFASSTVVYMIVPDGDFDKTKMILGSVTPTATNYVTEEPTDSYIPLPGNIFGGVSQIELKSWRPQTISSKKEIIINTRDEFGKIFKDYLQNYKTFMFSASIKTDIDVYHRGQGTYGLLLTIPLKNTKTGAITTKTFPMTTDNIEGNPYDFSDFQRVELYFTIEDDYEYDLSRHSTAFLLEAFVDDNFAYESPVMKVDSEGNDTNIEADPNIIIKDISLQMVDVLTEKGSTGYDLTVVASDGNYFLAGTYTQTKVLKPILKVKGKTVSDIKDWDCYWFIEDCNVTPNHNDYLQMAGEGWRCINSKTNITENANGNTVFQYIKNEYTRDVTNEEVKVELRYRCMLTKIFKEENDKENTVIVSGEIYIKNLDSTTELSLRTVENTNTFNKDIGNVQMIAQIKTETPIYLTENNKVTENVNYQMIWRRKDKNGNFIADEITNNDGTIEKKLFYTISKPLYLADKQTDSENRTFYFYEMEISFPASDIDDFNTIYCTFNKTIKKYVLNQETQKQEIQEDSAILGTKSMVIKVNEEQTYTIALSGADILYKYDSEGDSPFISYYDGPISSRMDKIDPITYKIYKPNGYELSDDEYRTVHYKWYFPIRSLLIPMGIDTTKMDTNDKSTARYYIVEGDGKSSINYNIESSYDMTKAEDTIIRLEVDFNKNHFSALANPRFLKDGQGGTNGSKYAAIITYKKYSYGEIDKEGKSRKLHMIWANDKSANKTKSAWYLFDQDQEILTGNNPDDPSDPLPEPNSNNYSSLVNRLPEFEVLIYKNGRPLTLDSNNVESIQWKLYDFNETVDEKNSRVIVNRNKSNIKTCFTVKNVGPNSYNGRLSLRGIYSMQKETTEDGVVYDAVGEKNYAIWNDEKNDTLCSIVECTLKFIDEKSATGISNQEIIRAYYPIEISWIPKYQAKNATIPTLEGGFSEVLYNLDGDHPEYNNEEISNVYKFKYDKDGNIILDKDKNPVIEIDDETKNPKIYKCNFECKNSIGQREVPNHFLGKEIYKYEWKTGLSQDPNDKNSSRNLKISSTQEQYAYIIPSTKYYVGESCNYIRVDYTWNNQTYDDLNKAITDLNKKIKDTNDKKAMYIGTYKADSKGSYKLDEDGRYIYVGEGHEDAKYSLDKLGNRQYIVALQNKYFNKDNYAKWQKLISNKDKTTQTLTLINYLYGCFQVIDDLRATLSFLKDFCEKAKLSEDKTSGYPSNNINRNYTNLLNDLYSSVYLFASDSSYSFDSLRIMTNDELNGLYPSEDMTSIQKYNLDIIKQYADSWKTRAKDYNAYIEKIIANKTDSSGNIIYYNQKEFNELYEFKNILKNIMNDDNYKGLYTTYDDNGVLKNPNPDYYDENNNFVLTAINVDQFKDAIKTINSRWINTGNHAFKDFKLESCKDYINNFLKPVKEAFNELYVSSKYQKEYYDGNGGVQDIFNKDIYSYNMLLKEYEFLKNDQSGQFNFILIRPILVSSNTTGLGYINEWDGTKLYIDEKNEQYIMAPLMGAGQKDEDGLFTGLVMGIRDLNSNGKLTLEQRKKNQKIGLHGLSKNQPSLFINAQDGSAIFGKSDNGQITIDPSAGMALLYNSNYFTPAEFNKNDRQGKPDNYNKIGQSTVTVKDGDEQKTYTREGMLIKFSEEGDDKHPYIHFAKANSGKIYSGDHSYLGQGGSGFYLSHDGLSIGDSFIVYADQNTGHPEGAAIIEQIGSQLAGWEVNRHEIKDEKTGEIITKEVGLVSKDKKGIFMESNTSTIVLGSDTGRIYSGGHYRFDADSTGFYLSNRGLAIGTVFKIDTSGTPNITFASDEAYICSGGRTKFGENNKDGFYLSNEGLSIGRDFQITTKGLATIEQEGSSIGGWNIKVEVDKKGNRKAIGFNSSNSGIFMDSQSSMIALGSDEGRIYSGNHTSIDSKNKGFYLDQQGLSIWNTFRASNVILDNVPIDDIGELLVGNLKSTSKKYWHIGGVCPEYKKEWIMTLAEGLVFKKDRIKDTELLKDQDTPFIPWIGSGATFITVTKDTNKGTLYMSEEIYPQLYDEYLRWKAEGEIYETWDFGKWPINPFTIPNIEPNCKVSPAIEGKRPPEDGVQREKEKYKWVYASDPKTWESYIGYGTDKLGVTPIKETDSLGEKYDELEFDSDIVKNNQIYLGTDGIRIGKSFAVDADSGSASFKGSIEATHGYIGKKGAGWEISKKGLFRVIKVKNEDGDYVDDVFTRTVILNENWYDPNNHNKKKTAKIKFAKGFGISYEGEMGIIFTYMQDVNVEYAYKNNGVWKKGTFKVSTGDVVEHDQREYWFDDQYPEVMRTTERAMWHAYDDGTLDIYAVGSHFGGVTIKGTNNKPYTYYNTSSSDPDEVFGQEMRDAIKGTMSGWRTVYASESTSSTVIGYVKL